MAASLGSLETRLLAYSQSRGRREVTAEELIGDLGWTAAQQRSVVSRLARKGLVARVRPGLYLVPPRLPPGGRWSPGQFLAISTLMNDRGGRYQISGPSAFYRYGWTGQVLNRLYAYNNRISGDRQIGPIAITLIKVADDRLGGTEVVRTPDGIDVVYASKARSLVDAVYDWSRFQSLPQAFDWIRREVKKDDAFAAELVRTTIQFGNQGTIRRIGALLEMQEVQGPLLQRLARQTRPSSSFIPWIPNREKRGTTNKRWGVVINDEAMTFPASCGNLCA
jgi:predicted transcriptional regulator of viral defense system